MRKFMHLLLLLFLPLLILSQTSIEAGAVSGIWSLANSPYEVRGDINVPLGTTLSIEPGTRIYFSGEYQLDVFGRLLAEGTESDTIFFYSDSLGEADSYPYYAGFWNGIAFHSTDANGQEPSSLNYCDMRYGYGNWLDDISDRAGAALALYQSSIRISNTNIEDNYVDRYGGGIYAFGGVVTLEHVTIRNSRASWGGGVYFENVDANLIDVMITGCSNEAIHLMNSTVEMSHCTIVDNASYSRAAIYGENIDISINQSDIIDNSTTTGLSVKDATITLSGTRINGNEEYGAYFSQSVVNMRNCEIQGNDGFGLLFTSDEDWQNTYTSEIQNTLIVKNNGVGIKFFGNNNAFITNCTIADNTYDSSWGGIINGNVNTQVTNSIIHNNGSNLDYQAGGLYTYSIVQGNYVGQDEATTNLDNFDPVFRNAASGDYHLQSTACGSFFDSPGIDAGDPTIADYVQDCATGGLGTELSDIGAYGGAANRWDDSILPECHFAGDVSGVWRCEEIFIEGDITIPFGDTLQIMESVDQIQILGPYEIQVEGVLLAIGPESDHVNAHGDYIKFQGSNWHGIVFNNLNDTNPGTSIIENCRFDYADKMMADYRNGGAIAIYNSDDLIVRHSFFYSNRAELGGAMYIENADPLIEDCKFEINGRSLAANYEIVSSAGGAIYLRNAHPRMQKLQLVGNTANDGGAIFLDNSSPLMTNMLLVKNEANGFAGGIFVSNSSPRIVNMTAADNIAPNGGGAFSLMHSASQPEVINSIMWGNSKPEVYINEGEIFASYSILDSASSESYFGVGCLDEDPLFQEVIGNIYRLPATTCGLGVNSAAIDAGHPDSLDAVLNCDEGLGTQRADLGFYGGMYSPEIVLSVYNPAGMLPKNSQLRQNYPNPFNPTTSINFDLSERGDVNIIVYNTLGQEVKTLVNQVLEAGRHSLVLDASRMDSGIYFYKMTTENYTSSRKMILLK